MQKSSLLDNFWLHVFLILVDHFFNGEKMNTDSEDIIVNIPNLAVITVVDQNNIIGAH